MGYPDGELTYVLGLNIKAHISRKDPGSRPGSLMEKGSAIPLVESKISGP